MTVPYVSGVARMLLLGLVTGLAGGVAGAESSPRLRVAAAEIGCPGIEGSFVAVLRGSGEALLLSPREFPGSRADQLVDGGPTRVQRDGGRSWTLTGAWVSGGSGRMWSAVYMTEAGGGEGCIAFDADRFSSEGDLVSYLRWVVKEVYLRIPREHRPAAFRLGKRTIQMTVEQPGFKTMAVTGAEGSTLALRIHGIDELVLVRAYPLDDQASRFAVFVAAADRPFWGEAQHRAARFELLESAGSLRLGDATATVHLLPEQ